MKMEVKPGKYVLAVSGGVDSMVLDLLAKKQGIELIVAHFNHGIREDAGLDEELVCDTARQLGLEYVVGYGRLGKSASEDTARRARYAFLRRMQSRSDAEALITAHHQDDMIETVMINIVRGTGRRGLVSIANNSVIRPLLDYTKAEIFEYAQKNGIIWREDSTNNDTKYLRNSIRKSLAGQVDYKKRQNLTSNIDKVAELDNQINNELAKLSQYIYNDDQIDRSLFSALPIDLGNELVVYWLKQRNLRDMDRRMVDRVTLALKTFGDRTECAVKGDLKLKISRDTAVFSSSV
jgi:tRNA(Ile)-lysidine synthase